MDDSDKASEQERFFLQSALAMRKPELHANGLCYNCGARVGGLFCDQHCRDDWERQKAAERRGGL